MSVYFEKRVYRGTAFHLGKVTSSVRANEELRVRDDEFPSGTPVGFKPHPSATLTPSPGGKA